MNFNNKNCNRKPEGKNTIFRSKATSYLSAGVLFLLAGGLLFGLLASAHPAHPEQPSGAARNPVAPNFKYTPAGWELTPAGNQKQAGFFPINAVLSPDASAVVIPDIVKNSNSSQCIEVRDAKDGRLIQTVELKGSDKGVAPGLIFSHDGLRVFAASANRDSILEFGWNSATRQLAIQKTFHLPIGSYPQDLAISPDDKTLYITAQIRQELLALDIASGKISGAPAGDYPFAVTLSADGRKAYVSNQGGYSVSVFSIKGLKLTGKGKIPVGTHPNKMVTDSKKNRLYVANGDSDSITVIDTSVNKILKTIPLAPYNGAPPGTHPVNLAISPDSGTLFVANSGNNDIALINVSEKGKFGQIEGLIPTAWYPTGIQVSPDQKRLLITSAKGLGTGPNKGADPSRPNVHPFIERLLQGTLAIVDIPGNKQLKKYTERVFSNNDFSNKSNIRGFENKPKGTIVPRYIGQSSPIKHIIYIVKENRTYDQVLGDLKNPDGSQKGNGDPSITLFGADITPNQHKLAQQFVTLDNFYANGEVSQNGWQWATQASSNPYNELATAQRYGGSGAEYDAEGYHPKISAGSSNPLKAYLWDRLAENHVSFRNYGQFVVSGSWMLTGEGTKPTAGKYYSYDKVLNANTDHDYPWFDMSITDQKRYDLWNKEFQSYVSHNNLPAMEFIALPRDHTIGGETAKQLVADNDLALGKIVDTVSHSKYWKSSAIFVVEDDAQAGPDHVDAHRTVAQVISPYTQTGKVDSHFYSQVSMLRTMELFLGIGPLSQFDAAALPMIWSFTDKPDFAPYRFLAPLQPLQANLPGKIHPVMTRKQMAGEPDQADPEKLNEDIWRAVKGQNVPMPAPQHNIFGLDNNEG